MEVNSKEGCCLPNSPPAIPPQIIDYWTSLLLPLIKEGQLQMAELEAFDTHGMSFQTEWSSLWGSMTRGKTISRAHNTSLLEALVHGDPLSTSEVPLDTFRDWKALGEQTGLKHFITIPALLFSRDAQNLVLVAGTHNPNWDSLLAYLVAAAKVYVPLPPPEWK